MVRLLVENGANVESLNGKDHRSYELTENKEIREILLNRRFLNAHLLQSISIYAIRTNPTQLAIR